LRVRWIIALYPWLELWSLIELGVAKGLLTVVLWVVLTFTVGGVLIRRAGANSLARLQLARLEGQLSQQFLGDDMALAVAGLLLVIPGLVSDVFAGVILIGPLRRGVLTLLVSRLARREDRAANDSEKVIIDGEFEEVPSKSLGKDPRNTP